MKDNTFEGIILLFKPCYRKTLLRMKTTLFFFIFFATGLFATEVHSQASRVTLDMTNASIREVLREIEKQSDYLFIFSPNEVDLNKKTSLNMKDKTVAEVLSAIFREADITYAIEGNNIMLLKRVEVSQPNRKTITGTVIDAHGDPLIGVSIREKNTSNGAITDIDGNYTITVTDENSVLQFSFIGYAPQEVKVGTKSAINISLQEDSEILDEVVVVAYGTQKKVNLTGAVSSVGNKDLTVAPVSNTTHALAGRLPGLTVIQKSGQPGANEAQLNIRGFDKPLIIVDGIEAAFHTIDPNMIESVTILKDGAAAIYGSRAGNGVVLVTTKRGIKQKPIITFSANLTLQGITSMPSPTNAGQYAELEREKWLQAGRPAEQAPFTEEQIQKYYDGTDPQYPNTNWRKELIKEWTPLQQYNLSVRGGNEAIRYYGFIGYTDQQSMWKNNGGHYDRYNIQSNIDATINDNLSFQLDVAAIIEGSMFSARGVGEGAGVWGDYWSTLPIYPASLPDPTKISYADGGGTGGAHISSNYGLMGYDKSNNQNYKGTASLIYKVPGVEGLSAKVLVNGIVNYNRFSKFNKPVSYYKYDVASDTYTLAGSLGTTAQLKEVNDMNRSITTQASLNYNRIFAQVHNLSALVLFEGIDYNGNKFSADRDNFLSPSIEQLYAGDNSTAKNDGSASENGRMSYVGRVNYSYMDRYMVEATLRADASARFSPSKRWGYFPSVSMAWRLSEEKFLKSVSFLDNLKLRVNFQYLSGFKMRSQVGYLFGITPMKGIYSSVIPNPNLSWEEIEIIGGGIDFSLLNRKIYGEADVFYRKRTGIPTERDKSLPTTFGASLPKENLNSLDNRGFELLLGSVFNVGEFTFDVSGNIAWSRDKWIHKEEPEYTDPDEIRMTKESGNWTDRLFGYKSDGLFTSQAEIDALEFEQDNNGNKTLRPGDVRFVDMNGDGKLDWRDKVELGAKFPHWTTGINVNIRYRDFDFTALFQGAFGYYTDVWVIKPQNKVYPKEVYELRWTEENNNRNALVPRMGGSSLNESASDYRYKKGNYLRLKSAAIGYTIPSRILRKLSIEQARITLSGTNLLTFDKLKKYNLDPEVPFGQGGYYYPQQRTFSLGLNVSF